MKPNYQEAECQWAKCPFLKCPRGKMSFEQNFAVTKFPRREMSKRQHIPERNVRTLVERVGNNSVRIRAEF